MSDLIVGIILLIAIGSAIAYIVKSKKNGVKCIGCPAGGNCPGAQGGKRKNNRTCSCRCDDVKNQ